MGRDETRYENAGQFLPERWLKDGFPSYDEYEMPVFQAGNRFCLGKDLAVYEIKILTIELLKRFRFEWPNEEVNVNKQDVSFVDNELIYAAGITLSIKGELPLKVSHRSSSL